MEKEISKESESVKAEYLDFDSLPSIKGEIEDFYKVSCLKAIKNEKNWFDQFNAINNLRRLLKFHPKDFEKYFPHSIDDVVKLSYSIRSNLSKATMQLATEVFLEGKNKGFVQFLPKLIPACLARTGADKQFIKEQAVIGLANLTKSFFYMETLDILLNDVGNKNLQISEHSFNFSVALIENWNKEEFSSFNSKDYTYIINKMINIYSLKKEPYNKRSCKLVACFTSKLGDVIMNKVISDQHNLKSTVLEMIEIAKPKGKSEKSNIKDLIQKDKQNNKDS